MSIDYCIVLPIADIPLPEDMPSSQVVEMATEAPDIAFLYTTAAADPLPDWPGTASVFGAWDLDWPTNDGQGYLQFGESYDVDGTTVIGSPTYPINADFWVWVNPLGNKNGDATGPLRTIRWQGHPEEKKAITDVSEYPSDALPYAINTTRFLRGPGDNAVRYTLDFVDPSRDPSVRSIWVFNDLWGYQYNCGSFTLTDGEGNFYVETPPGFGTATEEPVYYALHFATLQEGRAILGDGQQEQELQFWDIESGGGGPQSVWGQPIPYAVDQEVYYESILYKCLQAHTSQPGWEPPNVPALWAVV